MASVDVQADAPVPEVSDEQVEKSTQESPVLEEKPATSEEPDVIVHDEDDDEEIENPRGREEEWQNEVKDGENVGSPIFGEAEAAASLDGDEEEAEVEEEEEDMI